MMREQFQPKREIGRCPKQTRRLQEGGGGCVTRIAASPNFPQVLIWNLDIGEPVKMIDCHTDVILCMSFNTDGSLLATTCKDKKLRVVEPRSGRVLQVRCSCQGAARHGGVCVCVLEIRSWGEILLKHVKKPHLQGT